MDAPRDHRPAAPAAPAKRNPLPMIVGAVVVLALVAVGLWQFTKRRAEAELAQCQTLLGDAQAALAANDVARAEAATKQAVGLCTGPAAERLQTLTTEVGAARTREQTCVASETQASDHLAKGMPALARVVLDGARAGCAARPAFTALDAQAAGAEADARRLFVEAAAQLKAGDAVAADASLAKALATDAALADTGVLRAEIDKRLAQLPKPAPGPADTVATTPAPAPTPAKPEPAKPEPPKPEPAKPVAPTTTTTAPVATTPVPPPPKPAPTTVPTPTPVATTPPPLPEPPPAPAPVPEKKELVGISTPQPNYPLDALRSGTTGKVTATFTVNPDGRVSNVRIVKATPRGVFDRTVQDTVGKWRFQPIDAPRDITRTFTFAQ